MEVWNTLGIGAVLTLTLTQANNHPEFTVVTYAHHPTWY